jgi:EAL domain-containing protein (putative c-di-GMP-specific phosphodiesterase class I)
VLVFAGRERLAGAELPSQLSTAYPAAVIAGCSTAGEIADTTVRDGTAVVTAIDFERTQVVQASVQMDDVSDSCHAGQRLAERLPHDDLIHVLVLRTACARAAEWQQRHPQHPPRWLAVNVSARQLQHPNFAREVTHAIRKTGLAPNSLILEITESAMVQDTPTAIRVLETLRADGVRVAIDDFGTGYSSLSYLRQLPFDVLKLDRVFVQEPRNSGQQNGLTRAIVDLGKTLDVPVVAEGIERAEQLAELRVLQCEMGQGFFFARPMPPDLLDQLLTAKAAAA